MLKSKKIKSLVIICFIIVLITAFISVSGDYGKTDPFSSIKKQLDSISEEEKKILENLFVLIQEIEIMEREEKALGQEIESMNGEIKILEEIIKEEEITYKNRQEGLKQVLKSYQKMGPGSYLEILLSSDSMTTFIRRLNTLRDLTRETGKLLDQLETSSMKLSAEKSRLTEKLALVEKKQLEAKGALNKKLKLKEDEENYLASLKSERDFYQKHLADVQRVWSELIPIFKEAASEFSRIIEEGNLPEDSLKVTFSLFSAKGVIGEEVFNKVISEQSDLPQIVLEFHTDKVEMKLPEQNLVLIGSFIVKEGNTLEFAAREGNFFGMPLEPGSIEELLSGKGISLNITSLIGTNTLQAVKLYEGYIELTVKLNLF